MDELRLDRFFRRLALIDQRGVARLGVRSYIATEPGSCETVEMRRMPRAAAAAPRKPEQPAEIPALPTIRSARSASKRSRAVRLLARLAGTMRSAPPGGVESLPSMAPIVEWSSPCAALKKS